MTNLSIKNHNTFLIIFTLILTTSSIVHIEPAPYDLLLVAFIGAAILFGYTSYAPLHFWPIAFLLMFLETNLISLYFIQEIGLAINYLMITLYCVISWIGIIGITNYFGIKLMPYVFNGYVIAAVIIVIPGIIAYINQGLFLDVLLWEGRVKGFFKDPNVFGPFLIPPAIYALWKMGESNQRTFRTLIWLVIFLILALGVLLSFSRAAWGQFGLAISIYYLLINGASIKKLKTLVILIIVLIPVLIYSVMGTSIGDLFFERIGFQAYDQTRFEKQDDSLALMLIYPFGFGPGQSELHLNHSTHNLFIRIVSENGLLGTITFLLFYLMTIGRSIYVTRIVSLKNKGFFIIITASLLGILFNSMFIDTMHWRHFWLLLALPWMVIKNKENHKKDESL